MEEEIIQTIHFSVSVAILAILWYLADQIDNTIEMLIYERKERGRFEHRMRHDTGMKEVELLSLTTKINHNTEGLYLLAEKRRKEKIESMRRIVKQPKMVLIKKQ